MLHKTAKFWLLSLIYFVGINNIQSYRVNAQIISEQATEMEFSDLEIIDNWTEHFFGLLRPELQGKDIPIYETLYQREKAAIAQVVTHILFSSCQQQNRNHYFFLTDKKRRNRNDNLGQYGRFQYPARGANSNLYNRNRQIISNNNQRRFILEKESLWENDFYWRQNRNYFFEGFYQDLTDAIFYARHPEISLKEDKSKNFNLATEWDLIRRRFANYNQEQLLKKYLIPVCN